MGKAKEVKEQHLSAQTFSYAVHFFVLLVFCLYDNDLKDSVVNRNYLYFVSFFVILCLEIYFFEVAGSNPGIVSYEEGEEQDQAISGLEDIEAQELGKHDKQNSVPVKFNCKLCNRIQPYRTKHCKKCKMCVAKYDHHCFWIGGCVGELNLRKFIAMLFFMVVLFTWVFVIVSSKGILWIQQS